MTKTGEPFTIYPAAEDSPEGMEQRARVLLRDAELVRIAQALGVEPLAQNGDIATVAIATADGRSYSWTALVDAHVRLIGVCRCEDSGV